MKFLNECENNEGRKKQIESRESLSWTITRRRAGQVSNKLLGPSDCWKYHFHRRTNNELPANQLYVTL
jgi:hypothetical protein